MLRLKPACWLFLIPLPLFVPYLLLDLSYFWGNPDSIFYVNVYASYRDALWNGEIFPHWIADANIRLGSLAFYSLSPLVYSVTALLSAPLLLVQASDEAQFLLGIYASQVFGAWAMWVWLRRSHDAKLALAGALVYTLIPYKFIVLYQHFNLAQLWAMAMLPLWLYAAEDIGQRRRQVLYAVMAALCFYAHPLTVLSMGPVALAYALHCARWQWRSLRGPLLTAHLLALQLAASYLAAMLTAWPWMQFRHWSGELFSALGNLYHIDDFLGLYGPLLLWLLYRARKADSTLGLRDNLFFWGVALAVLYVVATPLSYPLWALVPAMNIFQFPFARLQPGMAVAVTLLAVALLSRRSREMTRAVAAILVLFVALCGLRLYLVYDRPQMVTESIREMARQDRIMPASVYMTHWTPMLPNDLLVHYGELKALSRAQVRYGQALADVTGEGNGWMNIHAEVESPVATVVLAQFYIPAWKAYEDGQEVPVEPYPNGLIKLDLPKGEHAIRIAVEKSTIEILGDLVTLVTLAAIPLLLRRAYAFNTA